MHHSLKDPSPPHPHPSLSSKNAKPKTLGGEETPSGMPTASAHPASLCPAHGRLLEEGPEGLHQPRATKTVPPGSVVGNARSPSGPLFPPEVDDAHAANPPHKRPTPTNPCSTYLRKSRLSEAMSSQMLTWSPRTSPKPETHQASPAPASTRRHRPVKRSGKSGILGQTLQINPPPHRPPVLPPPGDHAVWLSTYEYLRKKFPSLPPTDGVALAVATRHSSRHGRAGHTSTSRPSPSSQLYP